MQFRKTNKNKQQCEIIKKPERPMQGKGNDGKEVEKGKRGQNKKMSERRAGEMEADWLH